MNALSTLSWLTCFFSAEPPRKRHSWCHQHLNTLRLPSRSGTWWNLLSLWRQIYRKTTSMALRKCSCLLPSPALSLLSPWEKKLALSCQGMKKSNQNTLPFTLLLPRCILFPGQSYISTLHPSNPKVTSQSPWDWHEHFRNFQLRPEYSQLLSRKPATRSAGDLCFPSSEPLSFWIWCSRGAGPRNELDQLFLSQTLTPPPPPLSWSGRGPPSENEPSVHFPTCELIRHLLSTCHVLGSTPRAGGADKSLRGSLTISAPFHPKHEPSSAHLHTSSKRNWG